MSEREELILQTAERMRRALRVLKSRPPVSEIAVSLTMSQVRALFILYPTDGMSMKNLAETLGTSVTAVTGLVDRLEEHGLVERRHDQDDRRVVMAALTSEGRITVERFQEVRHELMAAVLGHLSTEQLKIVAQAAVYLEEAVLATLSGKDG